MRRHLDSDTDDSNHDDSYCSSLLSDTHEKSTIFVNGSNNVHKATEDLLDLVRVSVRVRVQMLHIRCLNTS